MRLTNLTSSQVEQLIERRKARDLRLFHPIHSAAFRRSARIRWRLHIAYVEKYNEENENGPKQA